MSSRIPNIYMHTFLTKYIYEIHFPTTYRIRGEINKKLFGYFALYNLHIVCTKTLHPSIQQTSSKSFLKLSYTYTQTTKTKKRSTQQLCNMHRQRRHYYFYYFRGSFFDVTHVRRKLFYNVSTVGRWIVTHEVVRK